jgi:hypothetical protein
MKAQIVWWDINPGIVSIAIEGLDRFGFAA